MSASKEIAEKIVASQMLEVLMVLSRLEDEEKSEIKRLAASALDKAVEWELIKPNK